MSESQTSPNFETPSTKSNWLNEFIALLFWIFLAACTYGISASANASLNPYDWSGVTAFLATAIWTMSLWGCVSFLDSQGTIKVESHIKKHFDIDEYTKANKSGLDSILSHYGYVATSGLFLAVSIFTLKPLVKNHPTLGGFLLSLLTMAAFFLYALLLLRLARRFTSLKSKFWYLVILLSVALIDTQAIQMIVKGTPESTEQKNGQSPEKQVSKIGG
jgi:drug/metabolite transporter (DMT)-like permease